jgi:hypothetical protein
MSSFQIGIAVYLTLSATTYFVRLVIQDCRRNRRIREARKAPRFSK